MSKIESNKIVYLVNQNLKRAVASSLLAVFLVLLASLAGLLFSDTLYPTAELLKAFYANDVVNLLIGLPILLIAMGTAKRGKLAGLLLWPGALLFTFYNYFVYAFSMPFNLFYLLYPAILVLCVYSLYNLLTRFNKEAIQQLLAGKVSERFGGIVLLLFGTVFAGRAVFMLVTNSKMPLSELALNLSDILLSLAWIICGQWLLRKAAWGYVLGLGLLFQGAMLFIGLITVMLVQPKLAGTALDLTGIILVFLMGFIVFIPFVLFLRGVIKNDR